MTKEVMVHKAVTHKKTPAKIPLLSVTEALAPVSANISELKCKCSRAFYPENDNHVDWALETNISKPMKIKTTLFAWLHTTL